MLYLNFLLEILQSLKLRVHLTTKLRVHLTTKSVFMTANSMSISLVSLGFVRGKDEHEDNQCPRQAARTRPEVKRGDLSLAVSGTTWLAARDLVLIS